MYRSDPGRFGTAITPSDTVDEANVFSAIWVGVAGNINLVDINGTATLYSNVPVGMFPMGGKRVNVTDTTATTMIGVRS